MSVLNLRNEPMQHCIFLSCYAVCFVHLVQKVLNFTPLLFKRDNNSHRLMPMYCFLFSINQGVVVNEATNDLFFKDSTQIQQTQFWRNLRKNNVRIHEDYEFLSRIGTQFVFINVVTAISVPSSLLTDRLFFIVILTSLRLFYVIIRFVQIVKTRMSIPSMVFWFMEMTLSCLSFRNTYRSVLRIVIIWSHCHVQKICISL